MKQCLVLAFGFLAGILLAPSVFAKEVSMTEGEQMSIEQNKRVVMRLFDEVFNRKDMAVIDEIYLPDMVDHSAFPGQPAGVAGIKGAIGEFHQAFDKLRVSVEEVIVQGGRVATRESWKGVHRASGKKAEGEVMHIFYVRDGRITDEWSQGWGWLEEFESL